LGTLGEREGKGKKIERVMKGELVRFHGLDWNGRIVILIAWELE